MSTKKVIAIVVLTNLVILASLLAYLAAAGAVMAFPPGPEGLAPPERTVWGAPITSAPTLPDPNYDGGWKSIAKGKNLKIVHNVLGDVDTYVVDMQCKDTANNGDKINNDYYGVDYLHGGATWWGLTKRVIYVYREGADQFCDKVRIRIWKTGA